MSHKVICIHGNPGLPTDFSRLLTSEMFKNTNQSFFDGQKSPAAKLSDDYAQLDELTRDCNSFDLICYSWGCYLAVSYLTTKRKKARKIIFLSPTLVTDSGVSGLVRCLMGIPAVGTLLLSKLTPGLTLDFISKSMNPCTLDEKMSNELTSNLSKSDIWQRAIVRKQEMFAQPLGEMANIAEKILVVRGEQDSSVKWSTQEPVVQKLHQYNTLELHSVQGAGHGLLWTHLEQTTNLIRGSDNGQGFS